MNHSKYNSKLDPKQQKSGSAPIVVPAPAASTDKKAAPIRAESGTPRQSEKDTTTHQGPSSPVKSPMTSDAKAHEVIVKQGDEHAASKFAPSGDAAKAPIVEKAALTSLPHVTGPQEAAPAMSAKAAD